MHKEIARSYDVIRFIVFFLLLCSVFVQIDASEKEREGRIVALLQNKLLLQRQIVNILKNDGIDVSQRTVSNVKRKIGLQRNSVEKIKFNSTNDQYLLHQLYSRVIEKINVKILHLNVQSCRISQSTVSTIRKSANFVLRKKRKVHRLTLSTTEKHHKRTLRQLANYHYNRRIVVLSRWYRRKTKCLLYKKRPIRIMKK